MIGIIPGVMRSWESEIEIFSHSGSIPKPPALMGRNRSSSGYLHHFRMHTHMIHMRIAANTDWVLVCRCGFNDNKLGHLPSQNWFYFCFFGQRTPDSRSTTWSGWIGTLTNISKPYRCWAILCRPMQCFKAGFLGLVVAMMADASYFDFLFIPVPNQFLDDSTYG
jgi:hypothetical protein